jgi:hypothetical protein
MRAVRDGDEAVVRTLLRTKDVAINWINPEDRQTPPSCGAEKGQEAMFKLLHETKDVGITSDAALLCCRE